MKKQINPNMSPHLVNLIKRVLEPLILLFVKYGVGYKVFDSIAKKIFVSVAAKNYGLRSNDTNISRISLMTGLTRKNVTLIKNQIINDEDYSLEMNATIAKLSNIWSSDTYFLDQKNCPLALEYNGNSPSFCDLVSKSKIDAPPKAVYIELERLCIIEKDLQGYISLKNYKYINLANEEILASRLKDLLPNS